MIGSVGGLKIPPVDAFIAGYQYCAKKLKSGITTLNGYSQDFVAQDKCKEVALNQIGQNADVVFQVAGGCGLGVLQAAKDQSKWGIGVDNDQGFLGNHVLTSATKKVDLGVFQTIQLGALEGVEGRRRRRLQRQERWRRLRQGVHDGTEPGRARQPPRQVVEGHRERQGQAAPHRQGLSTRRNRTCDGRAVGPARRVSRGRVFRDPGTGYRRRERTAKTSTPSPSHSPYPVSPSSPGAADATASDEPDAADHPADPPLPRDGST